MKYNIWNKWDPLKVCMLGNNWGPEFFSNLQDDRVRSPLQRIADETLEDLANFKTVLQDYGCKVIQPEIDSNERIQDHDDRGFRVRVPRNALQPRDHQIVSGNKLYTNNYDNPAIVNSLLEYSKDIEYFLTSQNPSSPNVPIEMGKDFYENFIKLRPDYPSYEYFCKNRENPDAFDSVMYASLLAWSKRGHMPTSANSVLIGKDVYVDHSVDLGQERLEQIFPDTRINVLGHGHTHADGCFHAIKPGAILSLHDFQKYENTFPGWDVCYLEGESWAKVSEFTKIKRSNFGKWWVPGEEDNQAFAHFVNEWLDNWVGFCEESVFDVNVLVLDERHVCVNNLNNETLNAFLKKHKMEAIHVPFRHRYFWDGGLHCITLDLVREGEQQDYFPDRKQPVKLAELQGLK